MDAPGSIQYFAAGYSGDVPEAVTSNGDDEAFPDCPGVFGDQFSPLQSRVVGTITGPSPASNIELKLRSKVSLKKSSVDDDDEADEMEITAASDGTIYVTATGPKDFDLNKIDLPSIKLGVFEAKPLEAKVVSTDERFQNWKRKPEKRKNYLFMKFDIQSLNIRCDVDRELILKGITKDGGHALGSVKVKKGICDSKIWEHFIKNHRRNLKKT